jgi:hypothetical protein
MSWVTLSRRLARLENAHAPAPLAHDWRAELAARLEDVHQRLAAAGALRDAPDYEAVGRALQGRLEAARRSPCYKVTS